MDGREFLAAAQRAARGGSEADWRTAAGRAYYALFLEARDALGRWGFAAKRNDPIHAWVRLRFAYAANADLKKIGDHLDQLGRFRNLADYQTATVGPFRNPTDASNAIQQSRQAIALLDQIEADPARRTAAIAAVQATIPP